MARASFARELGALRRAIATIDARWGRAVFAPPLPPADVARVEVAAGGTLPAAYRAFLREVSAGQLVDPDATGGLLRPDAALAERSPLPVAPHADVPAHALLPLRDHGDAHYDCLVLRGPLTGAMWSSSDAGCAPITARIAGVAQPLDFLGWVTRHLKAMVTAAPRAIAPTATRLNGLDLARFDGVPAFVATMTALEYLDLTTKRIDGPLPPWLAGMTALRALHAHGCGVTSVGDWIGACSQLRDLTLSDNQLAELPESLGECGQLESLYLGRNRLAALPRSLARLTRLRALELGGVTGGGYDRSARVEGGNALAELPDDLFAAMADLRDLRLSDNPLRRLPTSARRCPLEVVELGRLPALDVADALATLSRVPTLQRLILDGTPLSALPPAIFSLASVQRFSLIDTGLRALPDDVRGWRGAEYLFLDDNALTSLPDALGELPALKGIGLFGNPVPPEEVARFRARFPQATISI